MENFRLRVFRAVAQHLNFRVASEELLLTQPAVTQQIKALESELGTPLFDRSGGRVALTPAGLALVPYAEQLRRLSQEAREAVAAAVGTTAGELAIGASQTIGQYLLPRLLAAFLAENPRVQLHVTGGNTQTVLEDLRARRIQVALIEGPVLGHDLRVAPFMEDHLVCVVSAHHEFEDRQVTLEQLKQVTLLTREQGSGSRKVLEQAFEEAGLSLRELRLGLTFDSTEGLLSAVEAGLGVAFVSRWAVRNQLALGTLKVARVRQLKLSRMFSLATTAGPEPTGTVGAFWHLVLDRAEALTPRATGRAPLDRNPAMDDRTQGQ